MYINYTTSYWKIDTHMYIYMCMYSLFEHAQSCPTLCNPMDCSPRGSSVHGLFQARKLEWAAISSSNGSSRSRDRTCISCISSIEGRFLATWATWGAPCVYVCVYIYTNTAHISTIIGRSVGGMEGIQLSSLSQFVTTAILSFPGSGEAPLSSCLLFPGLFQPLLYTLENSSDSEWLLLLGP